MTNYELYSRRAKAAPKCGYCGSTSDPTRDHIVPKCLFTFGVPEDVITIPACRSCNHERSKLDAVIRDLLAFDVEGAETWQARSLIYGKWYGSESHNLSGKLSRSMHKNRSKIAREIVSTQATKIEFAPFEGAPPQEVNVHAISDSLVQDSFTWLMKGLHFYISERSLATSRVEVVRVFPDDLPRYLELLQSRYTSVGFSIGGDEFECDYGIHVEGKQFFTILRF